MWTRLWKTRGEVVQSTKGTRVHTPFFLSHHSCLYFWLQPCRSSCVNGDPRASPQLQKSQTAKDRCKPRYESPIMALTDEELSQAGCMELRGLPRFHSSAGGSKRCCCALSPQRGKNNLFARLHEDAFPLQVVLKQTSVKPLGVRLEQVTSD